MMTMVSTMNAVTTKIEATFNFSQLRTKHQFLYRLSLALTALI